MTESRPVLTCFWVALIVSSGASISTVRPIQGLGQPGTIGRTDIHHIRLNPVNPKAAAGYSLEPFAASAAKTTSHGCEVIKTAGIYLAVGNRENR